MYAQSRAVEVSSVPPIGGNGLANVVHRLIYRSTGVDDICWDSRQELEAATARWVAWFNRDRLHAELGYLTPFEMEIKYV